MIEADRVSGAVDQDAGGKPAATAEADLAAAANGQCAIAFDAQEPEAAVLTEIGGAVDQAVVFNMVEPQGQIDFITAVVEHEA